MQNEIASLTATFFFDFVKHVTKVGIRWVAFKRRLICDGGVAVFENLAKGLASVHPKQIVGRDYGHTTPVILQEDLKYKRSHLVERS